MVHGGCRLLGSLTGVFSHRASGGGKGTVGTLSTANGGNTETNLNCHKKRKRRKEDEVGKREKLTFQSNEDGFEPTACSMPLWFRHWALPVIDWRHERPGVRPEAAGIHAHKTRCPDRPVWIAQALRVSAPPDLGYRAGEILRLAPRG